MPKLDRRRSANAFGDSALGRWGMAMIAPDDVMDGDPPRPRQGGEFFKQAVARLAVNLWPNRVRTGF
jgi:hypothetical protein